MNESVTAVAIRTKGLRLLNNTKSMHVQQVICMSQPAGLVDCRVKNSPDPFGPLTNDSHSAGAAAISDLLLCPCETHVLQLKSEK